MGVLHGYCSMGNISESSTMDIYYTIVKRDSECHTEKSQKMIITVETVVSIVSADPVEMYQNHWSFVSQRGSVV